MGYYNIDHITERQAAAFKKKMYVIWIYKKKKKFWLVNKINIEKNKNESSAK